MTAAAPNVARAQQPADAGLLALFVAQYLTVGVTLPFFAPYLRGLGLSGREVALVLSLGPLLQLGVPTLWAWRADRSARPEKVLRGVCLGAFLSICPMVVVRGMPGLLIAYSVHQLFATALTGMTDALALGRAATGGRSYSEVRLWGSSAFAVTTLAVGALLSVRGRLDGDPLVPVLLGVGFAATWVASLAVEGRPVGRAAPASGAQARAALTQPAFVFILVLAFVHWMGSAPYRSFFAILVRGRGLSDAAVGQLFLLNVAAEVAAFRLFGRLRRRFSLPQLLLMAFGATVLRSLATARADTMLTLGALQLLHALTFGVYWSASLEWLRACIPPSLRNTGQSLFTAITFGLGSVVGTLGTGTVLDRYGEVAPAFTWAGLLELIPLALVLLGGARLDPTRTHGAG
jgi:PPP family 3-phenylpropionic acid transporter